MTLISAVRPACRRRRRAASILTLLALLATTPPASDALAAPASPDPGPRGGPAGAGGPLPGLTPPQNAFFAAARSRFQEIASVSGTLAGQSGYGLGPMFNSNSCASCHAAPAVGGGSPAINPQIAVAHLAGAQNIIPSFITLNGPVREVRFVLNSDGTPDGAVHRLFSITGRSDAVGCSVAQPDFATALAQRNVALRIPTPLFGLGLVESVPDVNLASAFNASAATRAALGIAGHFNRSANDGTIMRFGWKAQNPSLLMFAGEAYNVEEGVSNELFPHEKTATVGCALTNTPEDTTNLTNSFNSGSLASDLSGDIVNFAAFARLSAAPAAMPLTAEAAFGKQVFQSIGCNACHTMQQTTGASNVAASLSNVTFAPFSDFAVHHMGTSLADGITQGSALGDEFRTAPLWGVGQRLFFLHDGRTSDLNAAVLAHSSTGSEANQVIAAYAKLPARSVTALMQFLRSL